MRTLLVTGAAQLEAVHSATALCDCTAASGAFNPECRAGTACCSKLHRCAWSAVQALRDRLHPLHEGLHPLHDWHRTRDPGATAAPGRQATPAHRARCAPAALPSLAAQHHPLRSTTGPLVTLHERGGAAGAHPAWGAVSGARPHLPRRVLAAECQAAGVVVRRVIAIRELRQHLQLLQPLAVNGCMQRATALLHDPSAGSTPTPCIGSKCFQASAHRKAEVVLGTLDNGLPACAHALPSGKPDRLCRCDSAERQMFTSKGCLPRATGCRPPTLKGL